MTLPSRSQWLPWAAIVACAAVPACAHPAAVRLPNPMTRDGLHPNRVDVDDLDRAYMYGLEARAFRQAASLVLLDRGRVCFQLSLRAEADRADLASPLGWRVSVRAEPGGDLGDPMFGPTVGRRAGRLPGSILSQQLVPTASACSPFTPFGMCFPTQRTVSVRVPAMIPMEGAAGTVCFAHDRKLGPTTRALTLELVDPASSSRRHAFRWEFDTAGAAPRE